MKEANTYANLAYPDSPSLCENERIRRSELREAYAKGFKKALVLNKAAQKPEREIEYHSCYDGPEGVWDDR